MFLPVKTHNAVDGMMEMKGLFKVYIVTDRLSEQMMPLTLQKHYDQMKNQQLLLSEGQHEIFTQQHYSEAAFLFLTYES